MDIMFRALKTEFIHLERVSALTDYITTKSHFVAKDKGK